LRSRIAALTLALAIPVLLNLGSTTAVAPLNLVELDLTYGDGGATIVNVSGPNGGGPNTDWEDEPFWAELQHDGKLLVAGKSRNQSTGSVDFAVLRFMPDGTLDPTFGWHGIVLVDFVGARDEAFAIVVQPDDKIVVAGLAGRPNGNDDFGLVRLNPNGSRDTSFGWNGLVMTDFFGQRDQALGLVLLPDGKLVAGGYSTRDSTGLDFALARYNPNGSLDHTFGIGGRAIADYWGRADAMFKLALQPDGKLVGAGIATRPDGTHDFAVARFNANGSPDPTFGWHGRVATDFFGGDDVGLSLLIQPDGKVVVGGLATDPASDTILMALARYNANGSLDTSFGDNGRAVASFFGIYDQALWLMRQPDDKIIALGHAKHPARDFDYALARFTPDGQLDPTFGDGGKVTKDFFNGPDGLHAGVLLPTGMIIVAGDAYNPSHDGDDFALVRYLVADPSWVIGVVSSFPASAFSPDGQQAVLNLLDAADAAVMAGDAAGVLGSMQTLRAHLDGCPNAPAADDWIITCAEQELVRTLVDQIIAKLDSQ
jgi:uncharacterized delta-60 repeat protein